MKLAFAHIVKHINSNPTIEELSNRLFQLGHEHEIENEIFDMELTPNRGDCLSLLGLLRDLRVFYDINLTQENYEKDIEPLALRFSNNAENECPFISFLKIEIDTLPSEYQGALNHYFKDLDIKKNNFFTDISNFIMYETGQPTHCYDAKEIDDELSLNLIDEEHSFETLLDKTINLKNNNLVFQNSKNEIINLAGVIGGRNTACSKKTTTVIVECAYFNPEIILGNTVKYDIKSDAAHRFERGVDPTCQNLVLRRFLKIVEEHATIKKASIYKSNTAEFKNITVPLNLQKINKIIGQDVSSKTENILKKLGFNIKNNLIIVPSYRNDIHSINDIAEEISRSIGYDNIAREKFNLPLTKNYHIDDLEAIKKLKNFLIHHGFYEVINNPFVGKKSIDCISIDNPLDSNRRFLRTSLKDNLVDNLLFNERRQKDSVKFFEVSNIYKNCKKNPDKKVIGIIASGRLDKNYEDFSSKISKDYIPSVLSEFAPLIKFESVNIDRTHLKTKLKNPICYVEFDLDKILNTELISNVKNYSPESFNQYKHISDFPASKRDLSFSIADADDFNKLEDLILGCKNDLLKEVYIFDFYNNKKNYEIKVGFRFIFQSDMSTITDQQVDTAINDIIENALLIKSVQIPGLNNK